MSTLKYNDVKEWLKDESLKAGESGKMPTVRAIMKRFGVSLATVNRALQDLEGDGLIQRRQGSGIRACGANGILNRNTVSKKSGTLIFAYSNYPTELIWKYVNQLERYCRQDSINLLHYTSDKGEAFKKLPQEASSVSELKGIIINSTAERINQETVNELCALGCPVIFVDSLFNYESHRNLHVLMPDMLERGLLAGAHLATNGHERVAVIRNEAADDLFNLYVKGIRKAFKDTQSERQEIYCFSATVNAWENSLDAAQSITSEKLPLMKKEKITALMYYSTAGAFAAIQTLNDTGLKVPEDVSLMGATDDSYAKYLSPALTVVTHDNMQMIEDAYMIAVGRITESRGIILYPPSLISRKSVKKLN